MGATMIRVSVPFRGYVVVIGKENLSHFKSSRFRPLSGLCSSNSNTAIIYRYQTVSVPFRGYVVVIVIDEDPNCFVLVSVPFRGYVVVIVSCEYNGELFEGFPSPFGVM